VLDAGVIRKINSAGLVSTPGATAQWTSMAVDRLGRLYGVREIPMPFSPGNRFGVTSTVQRIADPAASSEPETITPVSLETGSDQLLALASDANRNVFLVGTKTVSLAGSTNSKKSLEFFQLNDAGVFIPLSVPQSTGALAACVCRLGDRLSLAVDADGQFHVGFKIYALGTESELVLAKFSRGAALLRIYRSTDIGSKDGALSQALFEDLPGLAADAAGNMYAADTGNHSIRKISPTDLVTTLAGAPLDRRFQDSTKANLSGAPAALINRRAVALHDVAVSHDGRDVYVNFALPLVYSSWYQAPSAALVHRLGSQGQAETVLVGYTFNTTRFYFDAPLQGAVYALGSMRPAANRTLDLSLSSDRFSDAVATAMGRDQALYFFEEGARTLNVKASQAADARVLAGGGSFDQPVDGKGDAARFGRVQGLAADATGQMYVVDRDNFPSQGAVIRRVSPDGVVTSWVGQRGVAGANDGPGAQASFRDPSDAVVDQNGNLYVADTGNHTIRKITPAGVVSTVIGQTGRAGISLGALPGRLSSPTGLAIDKNNVLYIATAGSIVKVRLPE
jgi:hypothetical protein